MVTKKKVFKGSHDSKKRVSSVQVKRVTPKIDEEAEGKILKKPKKPNLVIGIDVGQPGGDHTAKVTMKDNQVISVVTQPVLPHSVARLVSECHEPWLVNARKFVNDSDKVRLEIVARKNNAVTIDKDYLAKKEADEKIIAYAVYWSIWRENRHQFFPQVELKSFYVGDGKDALQACVDWMVSQGCEIAK